MALPRRSGLLALISRRGYLQDALALMGGTAIAQGLGILASPLLTRLYEPAQFGFFTVYNSIFTIFVPLATARYAMAVMLPKEDKDGFALVQASGLIAVVFSLIVSGAVAFPFVAHTLEQLTGTMDFGRWQYVLPFAILIGALSQTLMFWGNRCRRFKTVSASWVVQVAVMVLLQCLLALIGLGEWGLVWGHILGYIAGTATIATLTLGLGTPYHSVASWGKVRELLVRYKKFPLYMTWSGLMDTLSIHATPMLIAFYFTATEAGFYGLTYRIISAPISLIGHALSNVFFQRASEKWNRDRDVSPILEIILSKMILLSGFVAVVLFLTGPRLFGIVFGREWTVSGDYVRILTPMFFVQFLLSPVSPTLIVMERQGLMIGVQGLLLVATVIPFVVGVAKKLPQTKPLCCFPHVRHLFIPSISLRLAGWPACRFGR